MIQLKLVFPHYSLVHKPPAEQRNLPLDLSLPGNPESSLINNIPNKLIDYEK